MRKTFLLDEVDCAHCAAKMEEGIRKIQGVKEATISFLAQKLVLDAEDERFEEIVKEADAVCRKVDADCHIVL